MKADIEINGDFLSPTSNSTLAKELYYGFTSLGLEVKLNHNQMSRTQVREEDIIAKINMSSRIEGSRIKFNIHQPPYNIDRNGLNITWAMSPTPVPDEELAKWWMNMNVVFVSSPTMAVEYQRMNRERFIYMPFPVDTTFFNPDSYPLSLLNITHGLDGEEIPNRPFVFGSVLTWQNRSNIYNLLRAYFSEFSGNDNVALVIKAFGLNKDDSELDQIKGQIAQIRGLTKNPNPPKIVLIPSLMSDIDYSQYIAACDAYVCNQTWDPLHPSVHHAMACNKIVIAPDYNGKVDYCNANMLLAVESYADPVYGHAEPFINHKHKWYMTKTSSMCAAMRKAFESFGNPEAFKKIRKNALKYISETCASENVCRRILDLLVNSEVLEKMMPETLGPIKKKLSVVSKEETFTVV